VPPGQTCTRFAFRAVSSGVGRPSYGNFLDGVGFIVTIPADPTPTPTAVPDPTTTPVPDPTPTPVPDPTTTPVPDPTPTAVPDPTPTAVPDPTGTPAPGGTPTPIPAPTATAAPEATARPTPTGAAEAAAAAPTHRPRVTPPPTDTELEGSDGTRTTEGASVLLAGWLILGIGAGLSARRSRRAR
jgi:outer membrane biosynthesis protein TonB